MGLAGHHGLPVTNHQVPVTSYHLSRGWLHAGITVDLAWILVARSPPLWPKLRACRIVCKPAAISLERTIYNDRSSLHLPLCSTVGSIAVIKDVPPRSNRFNRRGNSVRLPVSRKKSRCLRDCRDLGEDAWTGFSWEFLASELFSVRWRLCEGWKGREFEWRESWWMEEKVIQFGAVIWEEFIRMRMLLVEILGCFEFMKRRRNKAEIKNLWWS